MILRLCKILNDLYVIYYRTTQ